MIRRVILCRNRVTVRTSFSPSVRGLQQQYYRPESHVKMVPRDYQFAKDDLVQELTDELSFYVEDIMFKKNRMRPYEVQKRLREDLLPVLEEAKKNKLKPTENFYNTALRACVLCREPEIALSLYRSMKRHITPTAIVYKSLIRLFSLERSKELVLWFAQQMKKDQHVLDEEVHCDVLRSFRDPKEASDYFFKQLNSSNRTVATYEKLIQILADGGLMEEAQDCLAHLQKRNIRATPGCYLPICRYYSATDPDKTVEQFELMLADAIHVDVQDIYPFLWTLANNGHYNHVIILMKRMKDMGLETTRTAINFCLLSIIKSKRSDMVELAEENYLSLQEEQIEPNDATYNLKLEIYYLAGNPEKVPKVLEEMKDSRFPPNVHTYNIMLKYEKEIDVILRLYEEMAASTDKRTRPDEKTYVTVLNALVSSNAPEETTKHIYEAMQKEKYYTGFSLERILSDVAPVLLGKKDVPSTVEEDLPVIEGEIGIPEPEEVEPENIDHDARHRDELTADDLADITERIANAKR